MDSAAPLLLPLWLYPVLSNVFCKNMAPAAGTALLAAAGDDKGDNGTVVGEEGEDEVRAGGFKLMLRFILDAQLTRCNDWESFWGTACRFRLFKSLNYSIEGEELRFVSMRAFRTVLIGARAQSR